MSLILSVAAASEKTHRGSQSIELVWTGPDSTVIPIRLTEQALLELIKSATKQLLMVSYAVYKIPRICEALVGAAERDVSIRIIIEEPDRHQGETAYRNIDALGEAVAARSAIFLWPSEKREKDIGGKPGILHVKCAVADAHMLLLSSANLTEYAFTVNMELGLLVTGGNLPEQIVRLFDRMIEAKVLVGLQLSRD
jgi:phosphatidylserine/phosphatidylglycerophosphate/cardiolipin synthase-like enzyme